MEGDAGASRLNPNETDDSSSSEVTAEDSTESEVGTDQTSTEVTAEDSTESEVGTDQTSTETTDAEDLPESEADTEDATDSANNGRSASRLGRGWLVGIAAALVVLAGGLGAGGYLALRSDRDSQAIARRDNAAVEAAKDCVTATQAPDTRAMAAAAQKMIECGTGAFRSQAILYSGLLVEAYQAANAQVQVSDLRAAVERNNDDGSVDVLVPLRVKMSNSATQNQEVGYRLRVTMVADEGKYRIAKLDQVAK
jgi:Mce-associated membrane protein